MSLAHLLTVRYPSPSPVDTQFVFVGVLKNGTSFYFDSPQKPRLILKTVAPFLQAQYDVKQAIASENQRLPAGFIDKKVIFMAKFTRVGVACNIIALEDNNSHSFTFTPKSHTFTTIGLSPPKDGSFPIEFFGLTEGDNLTLLYRFLMEEIYRN